MQVYRAPSNRASIAGRFALKSTEPAEIAAVNALMDQTTIAPLSLWLANDRRPIRAEDQALITPDYATIPRMTGLVDIATDLTGMDLLRLVSLVLKTLR